MWASAILADLPLALLFFLIGVRRMASWKATLAALGVAVLIARFAFGAPVKILVSSFIYGAAMLAFSVSSTAALSFPLLICAGIGVMRQNVGCNTLIQTLVQNDMRGRVMGIYAITFFGLAPLGNLLLGWLASKFGVQYAFAFGGFWVLCMAAWFVTTLPQMKKSIIHLRASHPDINLSENFDEVI